MGAEGPAAATAATSSGTRLDKGASSPGAGASGGQMSRAPKGADTDTLNVASCCPVVLWRYPNGFV